MLFFLIFDIRKIKNMYEFIKSFHSGWAYLTLLVLVIAVVNSIIGYIGKKEFTKKDKLFGLFGIIGTHTQLLAGFILYFVSPNGFKLFNTGVGNVMKTAELRLTAVEHPVINIIAITLITIGWVKHKKIATSASKFKTFMIFYGLGLLLILSRIPWNLWF